MKTTLLASLALGLVLVYVAEYAEGYQVYVHWGQKGCPGDKCKFKEIGCYKDTGADRDLPIWPWHHDLQRDTLRHSMTQEKCACECKAQGYRYAGVEFGGYCLCGDKYGKHGPATGCNMPCPGNTSQICGAFEKNWVLEIDLPKATAIYNGYVAKSEWKDMGGGIEFICVPEKPEWGDFKNGMQFVSNSWNSRIYGTQFVEYDLANELGADIATYNEADVPCTLCETIMVARAIMMMPGRLNCPPTWNRQYSGYLMAEPSQKKKKPKSQSNYICVDGYTGFDKNGNQNPHARLAMVEAGCGVLPCSHYPNGRELTCVVCVK